MLPIIINILSLCEHPNYFLWLEATKVIDLLFAPMHCVWDPTQSLCPGGFSLGKPMVSCKLEPFSEAFAGECILVWVFNFHPL